MHFRTLPQPPECSCRFAIPETFSSCRAAAICKRLTTHHRQYQNQRRCRCSDSASQRSLERFDDAADSERIRTPEVFPGPQTAQSSYCGSTLKRTTFVSYGDQAHHWKL